MRILIATPVPDGSTRGNRITAERWQRILDELGHQVQIEQSVSVESLEKVDLLIALHARYSCNWIDQARLVKSAMKVLVCLTGTDLHRDFAESNRYVDEPALREAYRQVESSLEKSDGIILLEPRGMMRLPEKWHYKCHVIRQSADPLLNPPSPPGNSVLVTVCGHLRPIKDPFLTAIALSLLDKESRIQVLQFGEALEPGMATTAEALMREDSRYRWIGPVSHTESVRLLAGSHLTVLSSIHEGAPSVFSEAIVNGVPILASRIDASLGLLGEDYPGLFEVKDTEGLATLLNRVENEPGFLEALNKAIQQKRPEFLKEREIQTWNNVLNITVP